MATKEPDRSAWRVNYENKSLSGIEVRANSGEVVNFITILHQDVVKDKEAHRTVINLDENSKPILPPKQTFEELIQAKRRQQAILFQHNTTTNSHNAILSNRAARRVVAAARNRSSAAMNPRTPLAYPTPAGDDMAAETSETPAATTTALLDPADEDQSQVVPRPIRRPAKRRRWPKLTRNRRSATARRKNRERALERAAQQEADDIEQDEEAPADEANEDDDKDEDANENDQAEDKEDEKREEEDKGEDEDQDATQIISPPQSPVTASMDTEPIAEQNSPCAAESGEDPEAATINIENDDIHGDSIFLKSYDSTIESDITPNNSQSNRPCSPSNSSMTIEATPPKAFRTPPQSRTTSRTRSSSTPKLKTKVTKKRGRPPKGRPKRKKASPSTGTSEVKVVTSIKALCKQNPSLTEEDHKEVKMLLKSVEPGSSIVLPNGTVIKKSRRGGARVGAGRKRVRPMPGTSADDNQQASRSPTHDAKHNKEQESSSSSKKEQTPPISPRCGSASAASSPAGRKSISRNSKKSVSSDTSKESPTKR